VLVRRYNFVSIVRILGLRRVNVFFLDGHAVSPAVDEVWHRLGVNVFYISDVTPESCFSQAIFIPFGSVA
jgi:prepilin-type processing-associated H-X9-DG protein